MAESAEQVTQWLKNHFIDHSQQMIQALQLANDRAWQAVEVALAGEGLLHWFDRAEDKALRQQIAEYLDKLQPVVFVHDPQFRRTCLAQLRQARKQKLLGTDCFDPDQVARQVGQFARFDDPAKVLDLEWRMLDDLGTQLTGAGFADLARLVTTRPANGQSLLVIFRRLFDGAVERGFALCVPCLNGPAISNRAPPRRIVLVLSGDLTPATA